MPPAKEEIERFFDSRVGIRFFFSRTGSGGLEVRQSRTSKGLGVRSKKNRIPNRKKITRLLVCANTLANFTPQKNQPQFHPDEQINHYYQQKSYTQICKQKKSIHNKKSTNLHIIYHTYSCLNNFSKNDRN